VIASIRVKSAATSSQLDAGWYDLPVDPFTSRQQAAWCLCIPPRPSTRVDQSPAERDAEARQDGVGDPGRGFRVEEVQGGFQTRSCQSVEEARAGRSLRGVAEPAPSTCIRCAAKRVPRRPPLRTPGDRRPRLRLEPHEGTLSGARGSCSGPARAGRAGETPSRPCSERWLELEAIAAGSGE